MKIAKYIFLLLLLLAVALFVFISTQPNTFSVSETRTINTNQEQLYNYVNDLNNWKSWWIPFQKSDAEIKIDSSKLTYSDNYSIEKIADFALDSIHLNISDRDFDANSSLIIKSTDKKTSEITWNIKGALSFKTKFIAFFRGGMQNVLESDIQQSFENIENELQKKFLDYSITLNGFETKKGVQYIAILDSTSLSAFDEKRRQNLKKLGEFITKQDLTINGDPFVIFKSRTKESYKYLSCIPVTAVLDSIVVDSTMTKGKFDSYLALKTTLKGSYSNRTTAWEDAKKSIEKSTYKENKEGLYIEVYKKESKQTPANNVTEIYIPVRKPIIVNEPKKDSLQTTETTKDSI